MASINCENGQVYYNWQCYTLPPEYIGGRGVTYWGFPDGYSVDIPPYETRTFSFTCTTPKCFSTSVDNCNMYFNAYAKSNSDPDARLIYSLNNVPADGHWVSGVANHGARQGFDITQVSNGTVYNDLGANTFTIYNESTVTVAVEDFKIMRVYPMCNLQLGQGGECDGTLGMCPTQQEVAANGNLDADNPPYDGRHDEPCNCEDYGSISFTTFNNPIFEDVTVDPLGTLEVTFDWTDCSTLNYLRGSVCIFNFNQIIPATLSANTDVTLTAYLNDEATPFTTYYLSNQYNHGSYPSFDLMQAPGYDDAGANTVKLVNNSDVTIQLLDDHGINIYRTYVTSPITCYCTCQTCQTCYTCQTCEAGCEIACQTACDTACQDCQTACETECQDCQTACQIQCMTCQTCYTCQTCEQECEITCQTGCEVSCQEACQITCQDCQTACEISCQTGCEVSCQSACQVACQTCYPCYICYTCMTCQSACELSCQTGCEVSCQTACEVSCQTGCEVSCQTACDTSCQVACEYCQICYPCHICYSWYT